PLSQTCGAHVSTITTPEAKPPATPLFLTPSRSGTRHLNATSLASFAASADSYASSLLGWAKIRDTADAAISREPTLSQRPSLQLLAPAALDDTRDLHAVRVETRTPS
ncbi:unnamed protein product, partial [Ectocarpus sp. 12 AP-2014]